MLEWFTCVQQFINDIIDLNDNEIGVRQSFLYESFSSTEPEEDIFIFQN